MKRSVLACVVVGLLSAEASAKPFVREARQDPDSGIEGRAGTGLGTFQDIQVPLTEFGVRADGHNVSEEGAVHVGIPVYAGVDWTRHLGPLVGTLGVEALRMSASSGPTETQGSTYTRFEAAGGIKYHFRVAGVAAALGGGAILRRSIFSNGSDGHYFQAPLLSGNAALGSESFTVTLGASFAPAAAFGYYNGSMFSGDSFKNGKTSLSDVSLGSSYRIQEDVFLDFGLSREAAQVTIADVSEYNGFGLQVSPTFEASRVISVATTVARIGFRKDF